MRNAPKSSIALKPCIHAVFLREREVGRARLELATNALKGRCSTIELPTLPQKGTREVTWSAPRSKCELHEVARVFTANWSHVAPHLTKKPPQLHAPRACSRVDHGCVVCVETCKALAFPDESAGVHTTDCVGKTGGAITLL